MKVFFDTEFTGLHQNTTLISIGLVSEAEHKFYAEFTDYDRSQVTPWIQENIISKLYLPKDKTGLITDGATVSLRGDTSLVVDHLTKWLSSMQLNAFYSPPSEMWADCLAYDWILFCQLWGGASLLPKSIYYIPFDLCTLLHIRGVDPDITREIYAYGNEVKGEKHNALWDAKTSKACYEKLMGQEGHNA